MADPWEEMLKPKREIHYDDHGFPKTLLDWRSEPPTTWGTVRHLWNPLEDVFEEKGYTLFVVQKDDPTSFLPKRKDELRPPDKYHEVLPEDGRIPGSVESYTNKLCPATRKSDGMHVMLCLICKGDAGHDELNILRYFSQPDLADNPANHVIPLLGEIHHLDMIFAVLPLMSVNTILWPAFHDWSELLDAMEQTFEALDFLHSHFVAHRDLGSSDIIYNFGGSRHGQQYKSALHRGGPFRSLFKCRYYLVDFELAVQFESTSEPKDRVVSGIPCTQSHGVEEASAYGKPMPPEWLIGRTYCPFASDVFQLGRMWRDYIKEEIKWDQSGVQGALSLLTHMSDETAGNRPDISEALRRLRSC